MDNLKFIDAKDVKGLATKGCHILDVRTDMEHRELHLDCAHNHTPLDMLDVEAYAQKHNLSKDSEIYILCRSGKRAAAATEQFNTAGYTNVHVITGGIIACQDCGTDLRGTNAPAKSGSCCPASPAHKSPITLERQVRIAAGLIVMIGASLSLVVSPYFALIPIGVGGGLVFAGITDQCGLALMIAKAPWNK